MTTPFATMPKQSASARSVLPWLTNSPLHILPVMDETVRYVLALPAHQVWTPHYWYTGQPLPENWWNLWKPVLEQEPELLYVMACAPSGRVRMRACMELVKQPSSLGLALLLVRSNDWVDVVKQTARSSLSPFLNPDYAAWWVEALPLVLRFEQNLRAPFPELREKVKTLLQMPEAATAVSRGWLSPSEHVRRSLLNLLGTAELPHEVQVLLALDVDQKIRRELIPYASVEILRQLLNDSVASIRSAAFERLLPSLIPDPQMAEFRTALLDTRSTVRWQAQYALRQAGVNVRAYYLEQQIDKMTSAEVTAQQEKSSLGKTLRKTSTRPFQTDRPCF